jgi:hypothetical protein
VPDWTAAIAANRRALELLPDQDGFGARAQVLRELAHCLRRQSPPDLEEAIARCREALDLLGSPGQEGQRADVERELQCCLDSQPEDSEP